MEERNMIVNILTKTFVVSPYITATKNPGSFKIIDIDNKKSKAAVPRDCCLIHIAYQRTADGIVWSAQEMG